MATIKITLSDKDFVSLSNLAAEERRPIPWQAELIICAALKKGGAEPAARMCEAAPAPEKHRVPA